MKRKLGVPAARPLADFLPTLTIKAKDFANELTSHNVIDKDLRGEGHISKEHIDNNLAVRKMLKERGVQPVGKVTSRTAFCRDRKKNYPTL